MLTYIIIFIIIIIIYYRGINVGNCIRFEYPLSSLFTLFKCVHPPKVVDSGSRNDIGGKKMLSLKRLQVVMQINKYSDKKQN